MARPILADESRPVDRQEDRLIVLADVMDRLVERPLEERRVDRHDRALAAHRQAGGQRDRVRLADPDVDEAIGELGLELVEARSGRHPRRDRHDPAVGSGGRNELGDEHSRVIRGFALDVAVRVGIEDAPFAADEAPLVGAATSSIGGSAAPWNPTWSASAGR